MRNKITFFALTAMAVCSLCASAQDYNDDDIYFDPSKAKKTEVKPAPRQKSTNGTIYYRAQDFPGADTYQPAVSSGISRNIDDYNRRGFFAPDTAKTDSTQLSADAFANTRRIEKYYNPDIVKSSGDEQLTDYYYAQPANVNIIVNNTSPWYSSWYYPSAYWGWSNWGWGPSWAWNYGWGPSWSWNWSWGPSWGWSWGYVPSWGWDPSWGWTSSRPVYRPRPTGNSRLGNSRLGSSRPGYRPGYRTGATNNSGYRSGLGNSRSGRTSDSYRPSNSNSYNNSYNNNSNRSNSGYRPGNSRSSSSSSWGSSSGGFSRGSSGGYSRGGGGGRGRH